MRQSTAIEIEQGLRYFCLAWADLGSISGITYGSQALPGVKPEPMKNQE